jgi:hypothetical protein
MKYKNLFIAGLVTGLCSCMPQRQSTIENPQVNNGAGAGSYQENDNQDPWASSQNRNNFSGDGAVRMVLPVASFEALNVDATKLFYTLKYDNEQGVELANKPRTKVVIDPVTSQAVVEMKVPNSSSGFITMTIDEDVANGSKFKGKSDKIIVNGPTKVALKLKRLDDAADLTVGVSFDDQGADGDSDNTGDTGVDVSGISNSELASFIRSTGNPNDWQTPTLEQIKVVAARFCGDCHTPGKAYGDTAKKEFYETRLLNGRLVSSLMPSPRTTYATEMDEAALAGFDYRAAMLRYSSSLGNNR